MNSNVLNTIEKIRPLILLHAKESLWGDVEKRTEAIKHTHWRYVKHFQTDTVLAYLRLLLRIMNPRSKRSVLLFAAIQTKYATSILKRISKSGSIEVSINSSAILKEWHKKRFVSPDSYVGK